MTKRNRFVALAISSVLALGVLAGCGTGGNAGAGSTDNKTASQENAKPKLIMGTSADYKPFEYHDTSSGKDEIVGFDIDIAKYIADEVGFDLEIKDMDFNGLLPALQSGRVDFVMAGMSPDDERKKNADFSDVYFEAKNSIVAKKGSGLAKPEDLAGKKVGVQLGSIQETAAKEIAESNKGVEVVSLNKLGEIVQELKSGRIDAAIIEDVVAKGYMKTNPDLEMSLIEQDGSNGSAVAFPKGSANVDKFNQAIKKLQDSGELDKLIMKWFDQ
ncbi:transporter substrate-binding domain-containing protein [Brevibacillus massiliensis]|jgi:polar amino acid transport system substrate-binding protein|uniref:transporter substrate-binding domain-containing protein n=1 Tax=Brevibacillus massiliensis TaxID=1118054 RepID=UPI0002F2AE5D|nr:transporter substrate-binding domain-containing protein [Brevibacillus massiliensis]